MLQGNAPSLGFISGSNGWSSTVIQDDWVRSASQLTIIGESQDVYCHFVYVSAFFNGAYSGEPGERIPAIQYNIITGEAVEIGWPYSP